MKYLLKSISKIQAEWLRRNRKITLYTYSIKENGKTVNYTAEKELTTLNKKNGKQKKYKLQENLYTKYFTKVDPNDTRNIPNYKKRRVDKIFHDENGNLIY